MAKPKKRLDNDVGVSFEARAILSISEFKPPKTTQDAVDVIAAELYTATLLRQQAEKRYEAVKKLAVDTNMNVIAQLRNDATENKRKETQDVVGEDWCLNINVNKPATRCDAQDVKTELIKRGISAKLIDEAITAATKNNMPALSIVAKPMAE
jgi:hypothetical protein